MKTVNHHTAAAKIVVASVSAAALLAASLLGAGSASASTAAPASDVTSTSIMTFHYNAARAAQNGYEVRTDQDGNQYAVPVGTPASSTLGATPKVSSSGQRVRAVSPNGTTPPSNCGTSFVDWTSINSYKTGYDIDPSFGTAVSHTWHVAVDTNSQTTSDDLSGFPPIFSYHWDASRTVSFPTGTYRATALAGGTTETTLGECVSTGPTDVNDYL